MRIISECYANQCFAYELRSYIRVSENIKQVTIHHNYKLGRDKILKSIEKIARKETGTLFVAVIDYERGIARRFIDHRFELMKIHESVFLGKHKRESNIIAIIFDPNIEEALICKYIKSLCMDINYYEKIKSRESCKVLEKHLKMKPISKIIEEIVSIMNEEISSK